ncbi:L-allo-threonine aldolase [bacterium HR40]|nr:L-allo-threonine aldolase [bacterium HR40]
MIDLRSDTVTQPTAAMREAIARAEVGDDVYGEDPTVRALEERVASLLGKEAALFVPSGTMANQVAIRTHTEPGDEIVADARAHVLLYERAAPTALSGVMPRPIESETGVFGADELRARVRLPVPGMPPGLFPPTRLVCLENTHNAGGGTVWPFDRFAEVAHEARRLGLAVHLDGARLWNAAVASGIPEHRWAGLCDSVAVCFSKGLGAPVGSAVAGTQGFIDRARRFRGMFGGAMRQAGVLAAAALFALEHHRERLAEDHANARRLAEGLAQLPGTEVDPTRVVTNILYVRLTRVPAGRFAERAEAMGVRVLPVAEDRIRLVTHLDVSAADIDRALAIFAAILRAGG